VNNNVITRKAISYRSLVKWQMRNVVIFAESVK